MISTIYRAEVHIPEVVWRTFGHRREYEQAVILATKGSTASGTDHYATVFEWAETPCLETAKRIERNLIEMVKSMQAIGLLDLN